MTKPKDSKSDRSIPFSTKVNAAKRLSFTKQEIDEMLCAWKSEEELCLPENVINLLFSGEMQGVSNSFQKEFIKVTIINQVYGTNLYTADIIEMAKYLSCNYEKLNKKLNMGCYSAVNMISEAIKDSREKFCYSFATKYCSFSAPESVADEFPIYDSYTGVFYKTMWDKWNPEGAKGFHKYHFNSWEGKYERDSCKYQKYKEAAHMLQKILEPERKMTVKELDQYLWKAMKTQSEKLVNGGK